MCFSVLAQQPKTLQLDFTLIQILIIIAQKHLIQME